MELDEELDGFDDEKLLPLEVRLGETGVRADDPLEYVRVPEEPVLGRMPPYELPPVGTKIGPPEEYERGDEVTPEFF